MIVRKETFHTEMLTDPGEMPALVRRFCHVLADQLSAGWTGVVSDPAQQAMSDVRIPLPNGDVIVITGTLSLQRKATA